VRWRDLIDQPFIGITRISSVRRLSDAAFVYGAQTVEPRYGVEQIPSAVALVEAGLGVTALPSLAFAMFKGGSLAARLLGKLGNHAPIWWRGLRSEDIGSRVSHYCQKPFRLYSHRL
jgi:DNA-binding transcriptional LysR family regulator